MRDMCINIFLNNCKCIYTYTRVYVEAHTCVHSRVHMYIYIHVQTGVHKQVQWDARRCKVENA